jgi:hypothetical protein
MKRSQTVWKEWLHSVDVRDHAFFFACTTLHSLSRTYDLPSDVRRLLMEWLHARWQWLSPLRDRLSNDGITTLYTLACGDLEPEEMRVRCVSELVASLYIIEAPCHFPGRYLRYYTKWPTVYRALSNLIERLCNI